MDNITGFNPTEAKQNIEDFKSYAWGNVEYKFLNDVSYLFRELYNYWCSPKAVDFYTKFKPIISETDKEIKIAIHTIVRNSWRAYNRLATANGYPTYNDDLENSSYGISFSENYFVSLKKLRSEDDDGRVGMNKLQVKGTLDLFNTNMESIISALDNVPSSIAFYDDGGEMQAAFTKLINSAKEKISSCLNEIKSSLTTSLEEEQDNILLAKQQATETLTA